MYTARKCRTLGQKIRAKRETNAHYLDDQVARLHPYQSSRQDLGAEIAAMEQLQKDVASQLNELKGILAQFNHQQSNQITTSLKQD